MGRLRQIQTFPVLDSVAWAVGPISKLAIQVKVKIRANMAKWEVMAATVLAIRIMETKDMGKIKDMVVMDNKDMVVMDNKGVVVMDKKGTAVTEDKKGMVVMDHKDMVATDDNEDAEAIEQS